METLRMWYGMRFDNVIDGMWQPDIQLVSQAYRSGVYSRGWDRRGFQGRGRRGHLSTETALQVLASPRVYPAELVRNAEVSLRRKTPKGGSTVAAIATAQGWFANEAQTAVQYVITLRVLVGL